MESDNDYSNLEMNDPQTLAYCMAILLHVNKGSKFELPQEENDENDPLSIHRKIVRALISEGLKVGILKSTPDSVDKIVLVVDTRGVLLEEPIEVKDIEGSSEKLRSKRATVVQNMSSKLLVEERARHAKDTMLQDSNWLSPPSILHESQLESIEAVYSLSPAEELVLTHRIIKRAMDKINIDSEGILCEFDILTGGARSTPIEAVVADVFPLQDEIWNSNFMKRLRERKRSGLRGSLQYFWESWIEQPTNVMLTEDLRVQFGEKIGVYHEFLLFYRKWVLWLTLIATMNYLVIRFSSWGSYLVTSSMLGLLISCVWGPWLLKMWKARLLELSARWELLHTLPKIKKIVNPNLSRADRNMSESDRKMRRIAGSIWNAMVVIINILLLVPISLIFTQWYAYGKMSPTCQCCEFLLESGIGNGTYEMSDIPQEIWPSECWDEYMVDAKGYALDLDNIPTECNMWQTCFGSKSSVVGTDRWVYILLQGIVMGLILDVVQSALFKKLTNWLTNMEAHYFLEEFSRHLIRKQFFFIWVNMFFWYLTITFLYVPYGDKVQRILLESSLSWTVPPWGYRPGKIALDEAFVTPMVATAFINTIIDTFVPSLLAKIALKARTQRRALDSVSFNLIKEASWHVKRLESDAQNNDPELHKVQNDCTPPSLALFEAIGRSLPPIPETKGVLHYFAETPDENRYNASEILTQSVLPIYDENEDYLVLVMQLGYVTMFTSAWGLLPLAASIRLMLMFRGSCYKILYACKRSVPLGVLATPGEWVNTMYITFLLGIPVICAEFSLASGGVDALVSQLNNSCAVDILHEELMQIDANCESLTPELRTIIAFGVEHLGFGLFLFMYLQSDILRNDRKSSKNQQRRSTVVPLNSVETVTSQEVVESVVLPPGLTKAIKEAFYALDSTGVGSLRLNQVQEHVQIVVGKGYQHALGKSAPDNILRDISFSVVRLLQRRDQRISGHTYKCTEDSLCLAYGRALRDPLISPFLIPFG